MALHTQSSSPMSGCDLVYLRGGLTVPLPAVELALDLERRGIELWSEENDVLFFGPPERVTDEDRIALRRWKRHLLALLAYQAESSQRVQ
jgi:hypothetical protein